jgi:protein-L-isoaspartate(D-aspartate) O-methyltransferase
MSSADGLYLWLTCTVPGGMFGLSTRPTAVDEGIVAPMFRWGALAAVDSESLAYLTLGPPSPEPASVTADNGGLPMDRGGQREIGVIGHGPRGAELVAGIVAQTRAWDRDYRLKTPAFTIQPITDGGLTEGGGELAGPPETGTRSPGEFVFRTPHNLMTISWHT